jgi:hypothetical protein
MRCRHALPFFLPLLLTAASCPPREEETYPLMENSFKRIFQGRIDEGIEGYAQASVQLQKIDAEERPVWVRPFMMYTLLRAGAWPRVEAKSAASGGNDAFTGFLGFRGPAEGVADAGRRALVEGLFHEQPGRWSRIPKWALPDLMKICGDGLMQRARAPEPLLPSLGEEVPVMVSDVITRLALVRAANQFYIRAWEVSLDQKRLERDCRRCVSEASGLTGSLLRTLADLSRDAGARARVTEEARLWEERASSVQENVAFSSLGMVADEEFIAYTVKDHFEGGLKALGAAVEERSGRGTVDRIAGQYEKALEHLLVAREMKMTLTKEDSVRLEFIERAVRGIHRLLNGA